MRRYQQLRHTKKDGSKGYEFTKNFSIPSGMKEPKQILLASLSLIYRSDFVHYDNFEKCCLLLLDTKLFLKSTIDNCSELCYYYCMNIIFNSRHNNNYIFQF